MAQDAPKLHVNPRWKECSFQLDPSLTQSAWRQFTEEAGLVTFFRPLSDARPLGKGRFELSALKWKTNINARDAAWNDTFVHPDSTHWLFEGSGLEFPGLTAGANVAAQCASCSSALGRDRSCTLSKQAQPELLSAGAGPA